MANESDNPATNDAGDEITIAVSDGMNGSASPTSGGAGPPPRAVLGSPFELKPEDYVRLVVTVGLLLMFGFVIVWSAIETLSWPAHWNQTKDMLQIILPALTGLIGSVLGFYFGSRNGKNP